MLKLKQNLMQTQKHKRKLMHLKPTQRDLRVKRMPFDVSGLKLKKIMTTLQLQLHKLLWPDVERGV